MALIYKQEAYHSIMEELPELFYAHWLELEDPNLPIKVDWARYLKAEACGKLKVMTARDGNKLVGYFFGYLDFSAQHADILKLASDVMYLMPEYRKGTEGWRFIDAVKQFARDLGAKKLYIIQKAKGTLTPLLVRKGLALEEETFSCLL